MLLIIASDPKWEPLFRSAATTSPAARFKQPSPWWAWHSIPIVEKYIVSHPGMNVLEWGSGWSTLWYIEKGASVVSIEHDRSWFELCQSYVGNLAELRHVPIGREYASPAVDYGRFGCIVIDGMMRSECAATVAEQIRNKVIKPGVLIVFDNSDLPMFEPGITLLEKSCARWRSYSGTTCNNIYQMTTLFTV